MSAPTTGTAGTDPPATGEPEPRTRRLAAAVDQRRTDRRRFSARPVPVELLAALGDAARPFGGVLHLTT